MSILSSLATSSGGSKPGRLRGGAWRTLWARTITMWRVAPPVVVTGALVAAVLQVVDRLPMALRAPFIIAVTVLLIHQGAPLENVWRRAYRHLEWFSAARAAGLVGLAEHDVDKQHDPGDNTLEVAPSLVKLKVTRARREYVVRPLPGQVLKTYQDAADALKIRWRAHSVTATALTGSRRNQGRIRITVVLDDVLAEPIVSTPPRPPAAPSAAPESAPVVARPAPKLHIAGTTQDAGPLELTTGLHTLVVGSTSGGKSGALRQIITAAARRPDCQLVLLDPKFVEFARWKKRPMILAREPDEITAAVRWVHDLMTYRYTLMAKHDIVEWSTELGPVVVVAGDEIADVFDAFDDGQAGDDLVILGRKARAAGICLVLATQRASADVVPSQLRANLAQRIVFRTDNQDATEFGLPGRSKEHRAHEIPLDRPGVCYVLGASGRVDLARVAWLAPDAVPSIDAATAALRLDPADLLPRVTAPPTPPEPARSGPVMWPAPAVDEDLDDAPEHGDDLDEPGPFDLDLDAGDDILEHVTRRGVTVNELVTATGLDKATVVERLRQLEVRGYVVRGGDNRYRPTSTSGAST